MATLDAEAVRRFGVVELGLGLLFASSGGSLAVALPFVLAGALCILVPTWRDSAVTASLPVRWWHLASVAYLLAWAPALLLVSDLGVPPALFAVAVLVSAPVFLGVALDLAVGGRYVFPGLRDGDGPT